MQKGMCTQGEVVQTQHQRDQWKGIEAVKRAAAQAGIDKKVGCYTLRHSFASHNLENGVIIRVLQELLGHADVKTAEIYTRVMARDIQAAKLAGPAQKAVAQPLPPSNPHSGPPCGSSAVDVGDRP